MERKVIEVSANCPSVEEFSKKYRQYGPYAQGEGKNLFQILTTVESFMRMKMSTELNLPAVSGVAEVAHRVCVSDSVEFTQRTKQFIGAVTCMMMEENGYEKENKKKTIPHALFTKGELYRNKSTKG